MSHIGPNPWFYQSYQIISIVLSRLLSTKTRSSETLKDPSLPSVLPQAQVKGAASSDSAVKTWFHGAGAAEEVVLFFSRAMVKIDV